ncbi:hypothetical protein [Sphingomonas sp. LHG3406-1]|uniref:hypothetical protein n=1 Tax=Sphingomonas sp. LHG3406-1 TaxID=2804617 RepID=UPI0026150308|nr:hypothetical protein [Sphingomonas sp. LHG3406-1]
MRAIILILILLVVGAIALVATGFVNVTQTQRAEVPAVAVGDNGVVVKGGEEPKFKVETGKIEVGTGKATIPVPEIRVAPGGNSAAPAQGQQPAGAQPATTDSTQR